MTFTPPPNAPHTAHRLSQLLDTDPELGFTYSAIVYELIHNDDNPVGYHTLYNTRKTSITEPELTAHLRTLLTNHDIIAVRTGPHVTYRLPQTSDHDTWQTAYTTALRDITRDGITYTGNGTAEATNPTPNPYPRHGATT